MTTGDPGTIQLNVLITRLDPEIPLPAYARHGDAGADLVAALIVLGIMVVMNQLEGHLLQPQVVGKMVRLHPLAVILVLAVAGVVAGIAGAVVAVPITAALTSASRALRRDSAGDGDGDGQAATRAAVPGDRRSLTQGDGQAGEQGGTDASSTGVA